MEIKTLQQAIEMLKTLPEQEQNEYFVNVPNYCEKRETTEEVMDEDMTWTICLWFDAEQNNFGEYFYDLKEVTFRVKDSQNWEVATKKQLDEIWTLIPEKDCGYIHNEDDDREYYLSTLHERM